jgi:hypothetical protein
MNNLINFDYQDQPVRVVTDEIGAPWWVARDVCEILGIKDANVATKGLDEDEKLLHILDGADQKRNMLTINESGLYTLIIRSNKKEARPFRKWVTSEVLPSIRKNGHYSMTEVDVPFTSGDAVISVPRLSEAAQGVKAAMVMARAFGYKDDEARTMANKLVKKVTGIDALELLEVPQPRFIDDEGAIYNEFLQECCEFVEGATVNATVLYEAFRVWCAASGLKSEISQVRFGKAMVKLVPRLNGRRRFYKGIRLK